MRFMKLNSICDNKFVMFRLATSMLMFKIKRGSWIRITSRILFLLLLVECYQCQSQTPAVSMETSIFTQLSLPRTTTDDVSSLNSASLQDRVLSLRRPPPAVYFTRPRFYSPQAQAAVVPAPEDPAAMRGPFHDSADPKQQTPLPTPSRQTGLPGMLHGLWREFMTRPSTPSRPETSDNEQSSADKNGQNGQVLDPAATTSKPPQQPLEVNFVLSPKAEPEEDDGDDRDDANKATMLHVPPQAKAAAAAKQSDQRSGGGGSSSSSSSEDSGSSDENSVVDDDEVRWQQEAEDAKPSDPPPPAEAPKTSNTPSQVAKESKDAPIAPEGTAASTDPSGEPDIPNTAAALAATRASIEELSALVLRAIQVEPTSTAQTTDEVLPASLPDPEAENSNESSIEEAVGALQSLVAGIIAQQGNNSNDDRTDVATGGQTSGAADKIQGETLVSARREPQRVVPAETRYDQEEAWPARVAVRRSPQVQTGHHPSVPPSSFPSFDTVYDRCIALRDMAAAQNKAAFEKDCAEFSTPVLLADEGNYNRCVVDNIETARYGELVLDWEAIHRCLLNENSMTSNARQSSFAESDSSSSGGGRSGSSSVDDRNYQDSDDADERQAQATYLVLGPNLMMGSTSELPSSEDAELSLADEASSGHISYEAGESSSDNEELQSALSMATAVSSSSRASNSDGFGYPGRQQQWRQQSPDDMAATTQERQPGSIVRVEIGPPQSDMAGNQQNTQNNQRDFEPQTTSEGQQQQFSNVPHQYRPLEPRRRNEYAQNTARRQPAFRAAYSASRPIEVDDRRTQLPSTAFLDSLDQSIGQLYCYDRNLRC